MYIEYTEDYEGHSSGVGRAGSSVNQRIDGSIPRLRYRPFQCVLGQDT